MITAKVPFTWDHDIDGFTYATYEIVATVAKANNRPVIVDIVMEGFQGEEVVTHAMPDAFKIPAMKSMSKNIHFIAESTHYLIGAGEVFEDENSFYSLFVNNFSDVFGIKTGTQV